MTKMKQLLKLFIILPGLVVGAERDRTTLKGFFETDDLPTEAQFADLIDSFWNLSDDRLLSLSAAETVTLNVGDAFITQSHVIVAAEDEGGGETTDDLVSIDCAAQAAGDLVIVRPDAGDTITVKTTGNIDLGGLGDAVLNSVDEYLVFLYDGAEYDLVFASPNTQTVDLTDYVNADHFADADWGTYFTVSSGDVLIDTDVIDTEHYAEDSVDITALKEIPISIGVACSDETTDLTTGPAKVTFRAPYAFTLTGVRANVNTAPTDATLNVDINEGGSSVLSTVITIDATEETSTTAATAAVISDAAIADDAEITIDIDQIGSTAAGKGLKVWLLGTRSL